MSNQIKHTPGPWRVKELHGDGEEGEIYGVWHPQTVDFSDTVCNTFSKADAHFIAAAPDLLEVTRLGVAMRAAQNAYFANRTKENLVASKQAESAFDRAARAVLAKLEVTG